ncbi:hypothetical protein VPNG_00196 [Cytospora leucostoma]|uniref:Diphthine--ammonia ligase n=1 Tax=Cytospora leucostoma TaxID=1230097 RepID=A0A423XPB5_9PEZI|nr:hypothetical protein VPNG_00196 [Cytospora leucostoma]
MAAAAAAAGAAPGASPGSGGLNVIALVSGGKDSFFSALHCLENGHRLVALANLHPPSPPPQGASPRAAEAGPGGVAGLSPDLGLAELDLGAEGKHDGENGRRQDGDDDEDEETDLNSFMYQTVGHQVIPLYAEATGIPLYRRPILGGAVQHGRDYSSSTAAAAAAAAEGAGRDDLDDDDDETESMIPLLREVMRNHPEANALSAGAILSTYQRTRVESVAVRLGLAPLAYLWRYPFLPRPAGAPEDDGAQLLVDMAAAGLEARIIKVASGGLDEEFLWEDVAGARGVMRLKRAMGRFGASLESGAVLGEGGEFETLVVDGPPGLFRKRIVVDEDDKVVVREGGGAAWMRIQRARLEEKSSGDEGDGGFVVRRPDLLDGRFSAVLGRIQTADGSDEVEDPKDGSVSCELPPLTTESSSSLQTWVVTRPVHDAVTDLSIEGETELLIEEIRNRLHHHNLPPSSIISTIISLRRMSDFPAINKIYGFLFTEPNPPSRVTISCGDLLPQHTNIAIYLTVQPANADRQGLHVQGRSYWAPANIGPYSQAITFPIHDPLDGGEVSSGGPRAVHIAGQIPLVPASMELPAAVFGGGFELQLALSLQHLWRIGVAVGVQWWTSAAVYFPRNGAKQPTAREKALLAWKAWEAAHGYGLSPGGDDDGDDDNEDGPDLWDRKFNPAYMSYGGTGCAEEERPKLPDYSILQREGGDDGEEEEDGGEKPVPFLFAAEVDELPRSAEAEWHAHAGLSNVRSTGSSESAAEVAIHSQTYDTRLGRCRVQHCSLLSDADISTHSTVAIEVDDSFAAAGSGTLDETIRQTNKYLGASIRRDEPSTEGSSPVPYLLYVDASIVGREQIGSAVREQGLAVIPCASIYGGPRGVRLAVVALYRNTSSRG